MSQENKLQKIREAFDSADLFDDKHFALVWVMEDSPELTDIMMVCHDPGNILNGRVVNDMLEIIDNAFDKPLKKDEQSIADRTNFGVMMRTIMFMHNVFYNSVDLYRETCDKSVAESAGRLDMVRGLRQLMKEARDLKKGEDGSAN